MGPNGTGGLSNQISSIKFLDNFIASASFDASTVEIFIASSHV